MSWNYKIPADTTSLTADISVQDDKIAFTNIAADGGTPDSETYGAFLVEEAWSSSTPMTLTLNGTPDLELQNVVNTNGGQQWDSPQDPPPDGSFFTEIDVLTCQNNTSGAYEIDLPFNVTWQAPNQDARSEDPRVKIKPPTS